MITQAAPDRVDMRGRFWQRVTLIESATPAAGASFTGARRHSAPDHQA
jgi:hypothetical protein